MYCAWIGALGCPGPTRSGRLGWPEVVVVVVRVIGAVVLVALGKPAAGAVILIGQITLAAAYLIHRDRRPASGPMPA